MYPSTEFSGGDSLLNPSAQPSLESDAEVVFDGGLYKLKRFQCPSSDLQKL